MTQKEKKLFKSVIGYLTLIITVVVCLSVLTIDKENEDKLELIAIKQVGSKKIKYYKVVNGEKTNIDKVTLESLMKQYDIVVEVKE